MSQFDASVVWRRLRKINSFITRLKKFEALTLTDYLESEDNQLIAERLIQLCTEAALDINKYILSKLGVLDNRAHWTNKDYFLEASRQNILTPDVARELADAASMRNILVHLYLDINPEIVFNSIQKSIIYYPLYVSQISKYIDFLSESQLI
ncbi:DUF86 domain-containing protein [Geitlerinema sp. P-1104]|uniref:type VII toxin-antitoxin system HepT family RNase toxin n=1 Tax=Geitlerinema sp. P-1104 TaxID=2546230 RepID=UPI0014777BF0|nr:DUF86 domain-containing protein [Geitlerinema sp. P-1104]NMG61032.1 DUF86 domain-containing protein [Geitlerinema sp. P-1104]